MFAALHIHLGFVIFIGPRSDHRMVYCYEDLYSISLFFDVFYTIQGSLLFSKFEFSIKPDLRGLSFS